MGRRHLDSGVPAPLGRRARRRRRRARRRRRSRGAAAVVLLRADEEGAKLEHERDGVGAAAADAARGRQERGLPLGRGDASLVLALERGEQAEEHLGATLDHVLPRGEDGAAAAPAQ
eukprot:scaffold75269_cov57-Phaeocystis_antarctica.AAC.4